MFMAMAALEPLKRGTHAATIDSQWCLFSLLQSFLAMCLSTPASESIGPKPPCMRSAEVVICSYQCHALLCRCINDGVTLQLAIAELLQSSLAMEDKTSAVARGQAGSVNRWPVWRKNGMEEAGHFYTIRVVKGRRQVVKRRSAEWQVPPLPNTHTATTLTTPATLTQPSL